MPGNGHHRYMDAGPSRCLSNSAAAWLPKLNTNRQAVRYRWRMDGYARLPGRARCEWSFHIVNTEDGLMANGR